MPRIGANDNTVLLALWNAGEGEQVERGQPLAELESTKEASRLVSPGAGFLHILVQEGEEAEVGAVVALLLEEGEKAPGPPAAGGETAPAPREEAPPNLTKKALALARERGVDLSALPRDRILREEDIRRLLEPPAVIQKSRSQHLLIYGTGGWTREILNIIRQTHAYRADWIIGGVGDPEDAGSIMGVPIVGSGEVERLYAEGCRKAVNAVAVTPGAFSRRDIFQALQKRGFEFPNLVHSRAVIDREVEMEEGNLILAGAFVGQEARIGSDCVINVGAVISHQCVIGDHCHVASGAVLAGKVSLGENVLVGQGCTIYAGVRVGSNVTIHNGCHVYRDVPDNTVVRLPR